MTSTTDNTRTAAEIRAEIKALERQWAGLAGSGQSWIAALEWVLSAPAPEAMSDAALVEAMTARKISKAEETAHKRIAFVNGGPFGGEIKTGSDLHLCEMLLEDLVGIRAVLAVARQHIGQETEAKIAAAMSEAQAPLCRQIASQSAELDALRAERDAAMETLEDEQAAHADTFNLLARKTVALNAEIRVHIKTCAENAALRAKLALAEKALTHISATTDDKFAEYEADLALFAIRAVQTGAPTPPAEAEPAAPPSPPEA